MIKEVNDLTQQGYENIVAGNLVDATNFAQQLLGGIQTKNKEFLKIKRDLTNVGSGLLKKLAPPSENVNNPFSSVGQQAIRAEEERKREGKRELNTFKKEQEERNRKLKEYNLNPPSLATAYEALGPATPPSSSSVPSSSASSSVPSSSSSTASSNRRANVLGPLPESLLPTPTNTGKAAFKSTLAESIFGKGNSRFGKGYTTPTFNTRTGTSAPNKPKNIALPPLPPSFGYPSSRGGQRNTRKNSKKQAKRQTRRI